MCVTLMMRVAKCLPTGISMAWTPPSLMVKGVVHRHEPSATRQTCSCWIEEQGHAFPQYIVHVHFCSSDGSHNLIGMPGVHATCNFIPRLSTSSSFWMRFIFTGRGCVCTLTWELENLPHALCAEMLMIHMLPSDPHSSSQLGTSLTLQFATLKCLSRNWNWEVGGAGIGKLVELGLESWWNWDWVIGL